MFLGTRRQRGGVYRGSRRQRGGKLSKKAFLKKKVHFLANKAKHVLKRKVLKRKRQVGGIIPLALLPLIAAGISAAGGIGASAAHAAISNAG